MGLKIAFIVGLSEKKLRQKLQPLQYIDEIECIDLYRRRTFSGDKINWIPIPDFAQKYAVIGDVFRFVQLIFKGRKYDVIIGCHQPFHGLMACIAGWLWRKPVIQMIIAGVDWIYDRPLLRFAVRSASACAVRGPNALKRLKTLGFNKTIKIIANPFNIEIETDNEPQKQVYDLIAVGNYADEKGYSWMLDIVSRICKEIPDFSLCVFGTGDYKKHLGGKLKNFGIERNVSFPGWRSDEELTRIYQSSRAFMLTSYSEGLPMVVIEAMAHGLPVFATSVGELTWLIRDNQDGRLFSYGDTDEMAMAIISAMKSPIKLKKMSNQAARRIEGLSGEFMVDQIANHWRLLLASLRQ